MNIHPIVVHFPIALLTVYSLLEIVRLRRITGLPYYRSIKVFLVVLGALGSIAGVISGSIAYDLIENSSSIEQVASIHSLFGLVSSLIYITIGLVYSGWIKKLSYWLDRPAVLIVLSILGLISITVTGSLGGIMVYGTGGDPFTSLVGKVILPGY